MGNLTMIRRTGALVCMALLLTGCARREPVPGQGIPLQEPLWTETPETATPGPAVFERLPVVSGPVQTAQAVPALPPEQTQPVQTSAPARTESTAETALPAQTVHPTPEPQARTPQPVQTVPPAVNGDPAASTAPPASEDALRIVALENAQREASGLSALRLDAALSEAAQIRAQELTVRFDSTRPDGSSAFTVSPLVQGESLAMGTALDADRVAQSWLEAENRREGALSDAFSTTGIGRAEANGLVYWVQLFGTGEDLALVQADPIQRVLDLVNAQRAAYGLSPVRLADELNEAAAVRAGELTVCYDHTRPDGSAPFTVSPLVFAENIAMGTNLSADGVVQAWMDSPGHRANILNGEYTAMGVGRTEQNGVVYWDQLFGY